MAHKKNQPALQNNLTKKGTCCILKEGNARFLRPSPHYDDKAAISVSDLAALLFSTLSIIKIGKGCKDQNS